MARIESEIGKPQGGLITRKATPRREADGFFAGWGFQSSNPPRRSGQSFPYRW